MADPVEEYLDSLSDAEPNKVPGSLVSAAPILPVTLQPADWDSYRIEAGAEAATVALMKKHEVVFSISAPSFQAALTFVSAFHQVKNPDTKKGKK